MSSDRTPSGNNRKPADGGAGPGSVFGRVPFHPVLFAVYPVLALLAANTGQVLPSDGLRMFLLSVILAAALYVAAWLFLRRIDQAAILASFTLLLVLSYGRVYDGMKAVGLSGTSIVRHRYLLPVVLLLPVVVLLVLRRFRPKGTTPYLNLVAACACLLPSAVLVASGLKQFSARPASAAAACELSPAPGKPRPDIYLIIMDAYERDDVLKRLHGYDNSPFLDGLRSMGFYVAPGSLSNYRHTELSLSSLLNMEYIQSYPDVLVDGKYNQWAIIQMINDNRVRRDLECIGYRTVAVETGAFWTEWTDADFFLRRRGGPLGAVGLLGGTTRFEAQFLETTMARAVLDGLKSSSGSQAQALSPAAEARDLILFQFDELDRIASLPSPKLVFIHVLAPHPPFLFGPGGEPVDIGAFDTGRSAGMSEGEELTAYANQVTYLNGRLLEAMHDVLRASPVDPIIIIQGDHGWADQDYEDKLSILNAYHFPGQGQSVLYPTITPINSFRLLFDTYLGAHLETLPDRSYFSTEVDEYNFIPVANSWKGD
ncbi:MAG TPA: hypothetical protein VK449_07985 [Anaerolineales bacterium]|nr:hypothetical protein [Anaerolineales bacterium]